MKKFTFNMLNDRIKNADDDLFDLQTLIKSKFNEAKINANIIDQYDKFGENVGVRLRDSNETFSFETFEGEIHGYILSFREDENGKIFADRIAMNENTIKEKVKQDSVADVLNDIISDKYSKREIDFWISGHEIDIHSFLVTYVIEEMARNIGNKNVDYSDGDLLGSLSKSQVSLTLKYAKEFGVDVSVYRELMSIGEMDRHTALTKIQAQMELNGCNWGNLSEIKKIMNDITKNHVEQKKGR